MEMRNRYIYLVFYKAENYVSGSIEIIRKRPIKDFTDILSLCNLIEDTNHFTDVVMTNYKLLRKPYKKVKLI